MVFIPHYQGLEQAINVEIYNILLILVIVLILEHTMD